MDNKEIISALREARELLSRDVPLNTRGWVKKTIRTLKWVHKGLNNKPKAIDEYADLISRIYDEDRYYLDDARGVSNDVFWDSYDVKTFHDSLKEMSYWANLSQSDFDEGSRISKALRYQELYKRYAKRMMDFIQSFNDTKDAGLKSLKEMEEQGEYGFDKGDIAKYRRLTKKLEVFFKFLEDVEGARKSYVDNLELLSEWRTDKGPKDRTKIEKLYHTTVNAPKIKAQGFKINQGVKGLGGATDNMISTTLSKKVAIEIAISLRKIVKIAKGHANFGTIMAWAKKYGIKDTVLDWTSVGKIYFDKVGEQESIRMINKGYVLDNYSIFSDTLEEDLPSGSIIVKYWGDSETRVRLIWVKDKSKHDDLMMSMFRYYLGALESSGKGYDPLFFGVELKNFRSMNLNDIGTFEIKADMLHEDIKYQSGMYEYRIPIGAIQSIKQIS